MKLTALESNIFGKICFGFRRNKLGIVEINPQEAEVVRLIFSLYLGGNSLEKIQHQLHKQGIHSPSGKEIWSRDVLNKLLNNVKYTFGIVDYMTFFEIEEMKSRNCRNPNRNQKDVDQWEERLRQNYCGLMP